MTDTRQDTSSRRVEFIANCFDRILMAPLSSEHRHELAEDIAKCFQVAAVDGLSLAHVKLTGIVEAAEKDFYHDRDRFIAMVIGRAE